GGRARAAGLPGAVRGPGLRANLATGACSVDARAIHWLARACMAGREQCANSEHGADSRLGARRESGLSMYARAEVGFVVGRDVGARRHDLVDLLAIL